MQLSTYHWQVWWSYWGTSNWLNWLVLLSNENLWLNSTLMVKLLTRDCSPTQSAPQCALEWWQYFYQDNECTLRYPQYGSRFLQNEKNENNKKTFLTKPLMFLCLLSEPACFTDWMSRWNPRLSLSDIIGSSTIEDGATSVRLAKRNISLSDKENKGQR